MTRAAEPESGNERDLLLGWLAYNRDAFGAKCAGVSPADLVRSGLGGSALSLLGLMRHLTEMERVYAVYAIGGGDLKFVYGPYVDGEPAGDFDNLRSEMAAPSLAAWQAEMEAADAVIASIGSLDDGDGRSARANLLKLIHEYARHNGHADLIRESIDGATGE